MAVLAETSAKPCSLLGHRFTIDATTSKLTLQQQQQLQYNTRWKIKQSPIDAMH